MGQGIFTELLYVQLLFNGNQGCLQKEIDGEQSSTWICSIGQVFNQIQKLGSAFKSRLLVVLEIKM